MKRVNALVGIACAVAAQAGVMVTTGQADTATSGTQPLTFYVATNGNDRWLGRLAEPNAAGTDGPFASIGRAQAAVRQLKKARLAQPVTVVVRAGVYKLKQPLVFTPEDSGAEACPITYAAEPGGEVVLHAGRAVTGWTPWGDGLYRADLKAQGLEGISFHQLFYRGARQILARYPNFDPEHPRTGGFLYTADTGLSPPEQFVYREQDIAFERWGDISQAEVWTVFGRGWNFAITPILSVDTERCLITVRRVRRPFETTNRFFIQNVLGALDAPGEWFLDRENSVLYFYPPDGKLDDGDVVVPVIDSLIEVKGSIPYPHGYLNVAYKGSRDDFPIARGSASVPPSGVPHFQGFSARLCPAECNSTRGCAALRSDRQRGHQRRERRH